MRVRLHHRDRGIRANPSRGHPRRMRPGDASLPPPEWGGVARLVGVGCGRVRGPGWAVRTRRRAAPPSRLCTKSDGHYDVTEEKNTFCFCFHSLHANIVHLTPKLPYKVRTGAQYAKKKISGSRTSFYHWHALSAPVPIVLPPFNIIPSILCLSFRYKQIYSSRTRRCKLI